MVGPPVHAVVSEPKAAAGQMQACAVEPVPEGHVQVGSVGAGQAVPLISEPSGWELVEDQPEPSRVQSVDQQGYGSGDGVPSGAGSSSSHPRPLARASSTRGKVELGGNGVWSAVVFCEAVP